jgi:hypothetical protein
MEICALTSKHFQSAMSYYIKPFATDTLWQLRLLWLIDFHSHLFVSELFTVYGLALCFPFQNKTQKQSVRRHRRFSLCDWNTPLMWCCLFQKLFSCCAVSTCRVQFNWSYIMSAVLVTCCLLIISACCSSFPRVAGSYEAFFGRQWIWHTVERALVDVLHQQFSRWMFASCVVILKVMAGCS